MSRFEGPQGIVTNGLVLNLDAGDPDSYTRSQPPYVEVLVVAGGGGGGRGRGGGGGAGGLIYNSAYQLTSATAVTVTVGAGGAGGSTDSSTAPNGSNSVFGALTAIGGGGGAGTLAVAGSILGGASGGSGGGGSGNALSAGPSGVGGAGTAGQGFVGGTAYSDNATYTAGGGGGGAGGPGNNSVFNTAGSGAAGQQYAISSTSLFYAAGGGGGGDGSAIAGSGGSSIGGNGSSTTTGGNATANRGAGGGGGAASQNGGNGGSGIVIVRYPGLPAATGGTITYLNGYTIHTFTSSGTFTPYLWNELTGTGYNTTLSNNVFDPPVGTMLFTNGIAKYLPGGTLTDFPNTPSANATIVILSTIKAPDSDWKTLVRGATADHQVIINADDGVTLGMYDNNNAGFISSGFDFSTIPDRTTAYHVYFWKLSQSSPYYQFYYDNNTSSPAGTITNAAATFNNGFAGVGAYHDASSDPNQFSQEWGNIKVFLYYNRHLSQAEMDQVYNALKNRR